MDLIKENQIKQIDSLGRITIPKSIRDKLELKPKEEMEFYRAVVDGKNFICLCTVKDPPSYKYRVAKEIFDSYGLELPRDFLDRVMEEKMAEEDGRAGFVE